ncbi:DUF4432 family protein [Leifsonia shinshuensis]|uniref:DUF4432 family protein n=1 Tax=Leifsonia shinshuensis TaxID=150026 RepID=UPI001F50E57C|nr:DUF4432 family protein [Leifsonia shinshuensis]MCI0158756.1 DUF4432 family protein [Leifsonia shinshuensis]
MSDEPSSLALRSRSGLEVEVRPEQGLDLGSARFRGSELAWFAPAEWKAADPWLAAFSGGLLATCGLHNVGRPSDGHGLHGRFALLPAEDVRVLDDEDGGVRVTGTVTDAGLVCRRTVTLCADRPVVSVTDTVSNTGATAVQAPLLYHVNVGGALGVDSVQVDGPVQESAQREPGPGWPDWRRPGDAPANDASGAPVEFVWEHTTTEPWLRVRDPHARLGLRIGWSGLDRVHQWVDRSGGKDALALEPANCSVLGRAHDRREGRAPMLAAGAERVTGMSVEVLEW